jgi:hypothetical protein
MRRSRDTADRASDAETALRPITLTALRRYQGWRNQGKTHAEKALG